jgi:acyl-[acyl carrier protein]--UDP-N-acetylglucosamine O-acyltransferase
MNQPLANIHPGAKIGKDVIIEPFVTIQEDVVIGDGCWIGPNAVILNGFPIGKSGSDSSGCRYFLYPTDLKFAGEKTTVEIGDHTVIREYVTISRGTARSVSNPNRLPLFGNGLCPRCSRLPHWKSLHNCQLSSAGWSCGCGMILL